MTNVSIIQWNAQGVRSKKDELSEMINLHNANIIAIQETKLWNNSNFSLPHYNTVRRDGHYNEGPHGGVAIFIHTSIPFNEIDVNTPIQAIAVRVHLQREITICNLYSSGAHIINQQVLSNLYNQLPQPCLIVGDFNAHNQLWGSTNTDGRGREIEAFITQQGLNIMNNGAPTRILYNTESAIDLSICSPEIDPDFNWTVLSSPGDSDHCPIIITYDEAREEGAAEVWNIKRARWDVYETSEVWNNLPDCQRETNSDLITDIYERIAAAASEAIPQYQRSKYYPKPWWNEELKQSKHRREQFYQQYRRNKSNINLILWRRTRAQHKALLKKYKRESWITYVEKMQRKSAPANIYKTIRNMKGKAYQKVNIIKENGQTYSTVPEIANRLAQTFSNTSSNSNYTQEFQDYKRIQEQSHINFDSDNLEPYNRNFTLKDLQNQLSKTKNTSPGGDGIYYQMIKKLPEKAMQHLCNVYNKFYQQSYFPQQWKTAIIVPIPKPGKCHSVSTNYRPIALTSCLCKIFERMLNERLMEYLEMEGILANIQCGCRKNRCTMDHLVRLENEIRKAFALGEHMVSVFFDLERAYDMTWKYGILRDLRDAGLRGYLPKYVREFLMDRKFQVRIQNYVSAVYQQINGVPQGSILSVTLFALKINSVARLIPNNPRFISSLYVDDLQISYRHCNLNNIQQELQNCLTLIGQWANRNGFKFSTTKTKAMHFTTLPGMHINIPAFSITNNQIPYVDSIKFLGLVWDSKLLWKKHISQLKVDCSKMLGIMRAITCQKWGADQFSMMKIYRMYIRAKLDYGAPIYASTAATNMNPVNTISTEALRIATGAFKSTPTDTLHILAHEPMFKHRIEYLSLRYYYKIKSNINNPASQQLIPLSYRTLFTNKAMQLPLNLRIQRMIEKYRLRKIFVKPAFSYRLLNIHVPTYTLAAPEINFELSESNKITTPVIWYIQNFRRIVAEEYRDCEQLYTDGSKREIGVGAAVVWGRGVKRATLPSEASIYSAEMHAIDMAIKIVTAEPLEKYVIFSDSASVLRSLSDTRTTHPIARRLLHEINILHNETNKRVTFCWIPSHVGIEGNEKADRAAFEAAAGPEEYIAIEYKDWYPIIKQKIEEAWTNEWRGTARKLKEIKKEPTPWKIIKTVRREEVIVNRLRAGHCLATHGYLMDNEQIDVPPICEGCNNAILTVKHMLVQCPAYQVQRGRMKVYQQGRVVALKDILGDKLDVADLMQFLREIQMSDKI